MFGVGCFGVRCSLCVVCCVCHVLLVVCCLLFVVFGFVACCVLSLAICRVLVVVCSSMTGVRCWLLVALHSWLCIVV